MTVKGNRQSTCRAKRAWPFRPLIYCRISPTFVSNYLAFVLVLCMICCCKQVLGGFGLLTLACCWESIVSHEKDCFSEKLLGRFLFLLLFFFLLFLARCSSLSQSCVRSLHIWNDPWPLVFLCYFVTWKSWGRGGIKKLCKQRSY